eukprot:224456-Chlamydomonas_euryale.AAC.1
MTHDPYPYPFNSTSLSRSLPPPHLLSLLAPLRSPLLYTGLPPAGVASDLGRSRSRRRPPRCQRHGAHARRGPLPLLRRAAVPDGCAAGGAPSAWDVWARRRRRVGRARWALERSARQPAAQVLHRAARACRAWSAGRRRRELRDAVRGPGAGCGRRGARGAAVVAHVANVHQGAAANARRVHAGVGCGRVTPGGGSVGVYFV